jgi:hypothetical protein
MELRAWDGDRGWVDTVGLAGRGFAEGGMTDYPRNDTEGWHSLRAEMDRRNDHNDQHINKLAQEVSELRQYVQALAKYMGVEVTRRPSRVEVVRLGVANRVGQADGSGE